MCAYHAGASDQSLASLHHPVIRWCIWTNWNKFLKCRRATGTDTVIPVSQRGVGKQTASWRMATPIASPANRTMRVQSTKAGVGVNPSPGTSVAEAGGLNFKPV